MNYASPIDGASLRSILQRTSTKVSGMVKDLLEVNSVLAQIADADLKQIIATDLGITLTQGNEVDTEFAQVRDWQFHVKQYADNYSGTGAVSNVSFHVAKRVNL